MKKTVYFIILAALFLSVFIYSKSVFNTRKPAESMSEISVQLKWINQAQFAGFYFAKESGMYQKVGLNVDLIPGGPDISPLQAVISGSSDFGIIGADQIILAREKGVPVVAVAVIYKKSPVAIASLKKSNIQTPADLKGKTVAIVYGKDEEVIYRALLDKVSVPRDQIKEVPLTFDLSQIITGKVDSQIVYEMNEPVLLVQKGFDLDLIKPRDYDINYYSDTLFTTEKMIKENPDIVRKFVKATIKGWEEAASNQKLAIDNVMKVNPSLNREQQVKFLELSMPLILSDEKIGVSSLTEWTNMQNLLIRYGVMNSQTDLSKTFTNQFIDQ